ncbi:MAG: 7-carboxy-7-deazaguanine synthase QueE [Gloeobacterales cyanobacterium]
MSLSTAPSNSLGNLVEIFSAIQGEGTFVGERQLFVRLGGCDLRCSWCDSPHTHAVQSNYRVEKTAGQRDFLEDINPVSGDQVLHYVEVLQQNFPHHSLSLTGGEPLLQSRFLQMWLPQVALPVYLETGGHRPQELSKVLPYLSWISMDIKLPSSCGESCWQAHDAFLTVAGHGTARLITKWVVTADTTLEDLDHATDLLARHAPDIPVVLQPVTSVGGRLAPSPPQVLAWQSRLRQRLTSVRVIPQTHKMIHQL